MKKNIIIILIFIFFSSCVGSSSVGIFGSGVSVAYDPRTVGMQIDDSIMQKNLSARLALTEKKYLIYISTKVLDGNIFLTGKVREPEEKLKIIKLAWETKGVRSVKTAITIKGETNFKNHQKLQTASRVGNPVVLKWNKHSYRNTITIQSFPHLKRSSVIRMGILYLRLLRS